MPNWCNNALVIKGTRHMLDKYELSMARTERDFSFKASVPIPKLVRLQGDAAIHTFTDCYWSCKWDASSVRLRREPNKLLYEFNTPWGPPASWLVSAGAGWPRLTFSLTWCEPGCNGSGRITVKGRNILEHDRGNRNKYKDPRIL